MPSIRLSRADLERIVGPNAKYIRAFEEMGQQATEILPDQITIILALLGAVQVASADASGRADDALRAADDTRALLASLPDYGDRITDLESLIAAVQVLALEGQQSQASEQGDFYAQAAETLTGPCIVDVFDDSGTVKVRNALADASDYEAAGFALASYATGAQVQVKTLGNITGLSGLTPGAYYYLSDSTPGAITLTAPTTTGHVVQNIGRAISPTALSFKPIPGVFIV